MPVRSKADRLSAQGDFTRFVHGKGLPVEPTGPYPGRIALGNPLLPTALNVRMASWAIGESSLVLFDVAVILDGSS